jgi:endonuclease/exonuclease/phosphatase family metal-dependent hydrolase
MKIFFLNCANRCIYNYLNKYIKLNDVDIVILAESKNVKKEISKDFKYFFLSSYKYGLTILSKFPFKIQEIKYVIDDENLRIDNNNYKERIFNISVCNLNIVAVHIDYGFYNPFAMNAIEEYLKENDVDIIIGDFNSGYITDNLNYKSSGIIFQNGYLYFKKYEEKGFVDLNKNKKLYSFISRRNNNYFRIDHCFVKNKKIIVEYVDEFLDNKISDHKGIKVEI